MMNRSVKQVVGVLLAMGLALGLSAGCGKGKTTSSGGSKTINISLHQDPPKLDPMTSGSFVDRIVFQSLYDKLVDLDHKGNIVPMLAEKWEISPDGLHYTFHLRKGVKFHDGTEFNAEAVKFNLERDMQKGSGRKNELSAVKEVKVIDPSTVEIVLSKPFAPFLNQLTDRAGMMVSPAAVKKYGDKYQNNPVGTGPFKFKERSKGNKIVLVKNPDYWQKGLPKADTIVYKIMNDANVALVNLKSGQLDMTNRFPLNEIKNYKSNDKITVVKEVSPGFKGIVLNLKDPVLQDKRVRQAINKAIDRDTIVKVALFGEARAARSGLAPTSWAYDESLDKSLPVDVEGAKKLLSEAGKGSGFALTIVTDTDPVSQQVSQLLQKQLKAVNIELTIQKMDYGSMLDRTEKGDYQMALMGWSGRTDPDGNFRNWVYSDAVYNYMKYSNPKVDALLDQGLATVDQNARKQIYGEMMKILDDELPYLYLYHENNTFGMVKALKGFETVPDGMIRTLNMVKE
jgi:peptide/nickel transport system substrate-binding protein